MAFSLSLAMILGLATVGDGPQGSDKPVERLRAMRAIADGVTMEQTSVDGRQKLERLAEPVYRFDDPARRFSDGTVWAWCRSGRPTAVLTLSKNRSPEGEVRWLGELTSLVEKNSVRERLRAQLMLALYRCGRQPAGSDPDTGRHTGRQGWLRSGHLEQ